MNRKIVIISIILAIFISLCGGSYFYLHNVYFAPEPIIPEWSEEQKDEYVYQRALARMNTDFVDGKIYAYSFEKIKSISGEECIYTLEIEYKDNVYQVTYSVEENGEREFIRCKTKYVHYIITLSGSKGNYYDYFEKYYGKIPYNYLSIQGEKCFSGSTHSPILAVKNEQGQYQTVYDYDYYNSMKDYPEAHKHKENCGCNYGKIIG